MLFQALQDMFEEPWKAPIQSANRELRVLLPVGKRQTDSRKNFF